VAAPAAMRYTQAVEADPYRQHPPPQPPLPKGGGGVAAGGIPTTPTSQCERAFWSYEWLGSLSKVQSLTRLRRRLARRRRDGRIVHCINPQPAHSPLSMLAHTSPNTNPVQKTHPHALTPPQNPYTIHPFPQKPAGSLETADGGFSGESHTQ